MGVSENEDLEKWKVDVSWNNTNKKLSVCFYHSNRMSALPKDIACELGFSSRWHVSTLTFGSPVWGGAKGSQSGEGSFDLCLDLYS